VSDVFVVAEAVNRQLRHQSLTSRSDVLTRSPIAAQSVSHISAARVCQQDKSIRV